MTFTSKTLHSMCLKGALIGVCAGAFHGYQSGRMTHADTMMFGYKKYDMKYFALEQFYDTLLGAIIGGCAGYLAIPFSPLLVVGGIDYYVNFKGKFRNTK
jgi:hypothetical protein